MSIALVPMCSLYVSSRDFFSTSNNILIVLGTPSGGGFLGPQSRTDITIFDDGLYSISPMLTRPINLNNSNSLTQIAGYGYTIIIQANNNNGTYKTMISDTVYRPMNKMIRESMGGERFLSIIENDLSFSADKRQKSQDELTTLLKELGTKKFALYNSTLNIDGILETMNFVRTPVCPPGDDIRKETKQKLEKLCEKVESAFIVKIES